MVQRAGKRHTMRNADAVFENVFTKLVAGLGSIATTQAFLSDIKDVGQHNNKVSLHLKFKLEIKQLTYYRRH